jgi:hypothetical protein
VRIGQVFRDGCDPISSTPAACGDEHTFGLIKVMDEAQSLGAATVGLVGGIDDIVKRLAGITDELLALADGDYGDRFRLEKERDGLRARAEEFHERKDEGRSIDDLRSELKARRTQLDQLRRSRINMTYQAGATERGGATRAIGAKGGGTINNAMMNAQGAGSIESRIAEIEQELARR